LTRARDSFSSGASNPCNTSFNSESELSQDDYNKEKEILEASMRSWFQRDRFLMDCSEESRPAVAFLTTTQTFLRFVSERIVMPNVDWFDSRMSQVIQESRERFEKDVGTDMTTSAWMVEKNAMYFSSFESYSVSLTGNTISWSRKVEGTWSSSSTVISGRLTLDENKSSLSLKPASQPLLTSAPSKYPLSIIMSDPTSAEIAAATGCKVLGGNSSGGSRADASQEMIITFYLSDPDIRLKFIQLINSRIRGGNQLLLETFRLDSSLRLKLASFGANFRATDYRSAISNLQSNIRRVSALPSQIKSKRMSTILSLAGAKSPIKLPMKTPATLEEGIETDSSDD
jgi:hypothetical protein